MKGIPSYSHFNGLNDAGWAFDASKRSVVNRAGNFDITIPLSILFGIFEDYKGFIFRIQQTLKFTKHPSSASANSVIANTDDFNVTVHFEEIIWRMPIIKFNPVIDAKIKDEVAKGNEYEINFRHWSYSYRKNESQVTELTWDFPSSYSRTKYILFAFQKAGKDGVLLKDYSKFDLCDLRSVQVQLNNTTLYPHEKPSWNLSEFKIGSLYTMFKDFQHYYYNRNEHETYPILDMKSFIDDYPIICIDCSRSSDPVLKDSFINVKIRFEWVTPLPVNTTIHAVLISDCKVKYLPIHSISMV